ncbi:MAG: hypothetical protein ACQETH_11210, partial [Candidatus Rifleibacteriota bacterium]
STSLNHRYILIQIALFALFLVAFVALWLCVRRKIFDYDYEHEHDYENENENENEQDNDNDNDND